MILHTGTQVDVPATYSEWLYQRIQEGFVLVRDSADPTQVTKYLLQPELIDALVFPTRNPAPMLERMEELAEFRQYWQVSISPYERLKHKDRLPTEQVLDAVNRLAQEVGPYAVAWRYEPIMIDRTYSMAYHLLEFEKMANALAGSTHRCVISFDAPMLKKSKVGSGFRQVTRPERETIVGELIRVGKKYGMEIAVCDESEDLSAFGIDTSGCMTAPVLERITGYALVLPKSRKKPTAGCAPLAGVDITGGCVRGCTYRFAFSLEEAENRETDQRIHNPLSPFLFGEESETDQIKEAQQERYGKGQLSLFEET